MPTDAKLVRDRFLAAAELPPDERAAYLGTHCANDPELLAAVERLLAAHEQPASALSQDFLAAAGLNQTEVHASQIQHPGELIAGRYKLLEQIGVGGMGAVWMAEQKEPVKRKVAVKLVKAGMDSAQVLARFEAERQALALMDHPNIAKVFDGGMTEQGRPFFVMEFVKGVPLTEYCNEARLSLKERLNLFIPVCQAVQHAHQKGIIHRDLKPSNILVCLYDGKPVPKVIDFGLAKAMHQSLTDNTIHTAFGMMVGTPLYMSPEQAEHNNLDVDTRTDIYSLGVILYELLTGTTPLEQKQLKQAAYDEILRLIKEVEPPKPSTRLSGSASLPSIAAQRSIDPKQLSKSLAGDLDWIAMKALDKERTRRYETANELARDVERYLSDETVEACPPSASYRLRKLMRKHRTAINTAAAFAGVLILGTAVSLWLAVRATKAEGDAKLALVAEAKQRTVAEKNEQLAKEQRTKAEAAAKKEAEQRAKAEKARDRTREALDAMTSTVARDSLTIQQEISEDQKKFLAEVLTYYKEFAGENPDDEQSRSRTATAALRVGKIEYLLGRSSESAAALQKANDEFQKLSTDFPADPAYRFELSNSRNLLGLVLCDLGRMQDSETQHLEAASIRVKLAADFPDGHQYRHVLAHSYHNLGGLMKMQRRRAQAEERFRKALDIHEKLVSEFPAEKDYLQDLGKHRYDLAVTIQLNQTVEAEEQFRKALAHQNALVGELSEKPTYRYDLSRSYNGLGGLLRSQNRRPEAEEQYRKALEIQEKLVAGFPTSPMYQHELARSHFNLGLLLRDSGSLAEAVEQIRKALSLFKNLTAKFPHVPEYQHELAKCHRSLGSALDRLGQRADVEQQYRNSLTICEKLAAQFPSEPEYRRELAGSHNSLGSLFSDLGNWPGADEQCRRAVAIFQSLVEEYSEDPEYRRDLAASYSNLGNLLADQKKWKEAEQLLRNALELDEKLGLAFPEVYGRSQARSHGNLGVLLADQRKWREAEEHDRAALVFMEQLHAKFPELPDYRQDLGLSYLNLGRTLSGLKRSPEAIDQLRKSADIFAKLAADFPSNSQYPSTQARCHSNLAIELIGTGKHAEAEEEYRLALTILEKLASNSPSVAQYQIALIASGDALGRLLTDMKKPVEAEVQFRNVLACQEQMVKAFPSVLQFQVELGGRYADFGLWMIKQDRAEDSLNLYSKAIDTLNSLYERNSRLAEAKRFLSISYANRANALDRLRRFMEAVADRKKAIELSPPEKTAEYRVRLAMSLRNAELLSDAVAVAEALTKSSDWRSDQWYDFACLYAAASGKIPDRKQEYADRAMELLRQAVKAGFQDAAHMMKDTDLDPLREREDFKKLLAELEKEISPP